MKKRQTTVKALCQQVFRSALAVEVDRKAVRFVPHMLDQQQRWRVGGEPQGMVPSGQVNLLFALGQCRDRELFVSWAQDVLQSPAGGGELAFSAVDQNEMG